jgi:acyl-CoA dehydrogenase
VIRIIESLHPLSFETQSVGAQNYTQDPCIRLLVDFFQHKGLKALQREDQDETWYADWIEYQSRNGIYASLLSPKEYSRRGHQLGLSRLTRFLEACAYFSPAHAYSLHTTFLGLFPIFMGPNEELKKDAVKRLEEGGLFAFGVSERAHGSDLFANEFAVQRTPNGWLADGTKYYIGNVNVASIITIMAKRIEAGSASHSKRAPFVLFALRPERNLAFGNVRKISTLGIRPAFVGEFEVRGHEFGDDDIISQGRDAWDAVLGTVNFGKFFLGFGAIGICAHAFAEAIVHLRRRLLYGKPVIDMPHIRATTVIAFSRLCAMKLYAYRALDYLQISCDNDRRYLLFNAVQKARVSTEGVKVMALLSECIGAKGFESETYFESALRDAPLIPGLEGSTHINFGLIAQFVDNYFAGSHDDRPVPDSLTVRPDDAGENPYWVQAKDRNPKTVMFPSFSKAYESLPVLRNLEIFKAQVEAFRVFASAGITMLNPNADVGLAIAIGKCFSLVVYGQLVAENLKIMNAEPSNVSLIFHALIEDLSAESLKLAAMYPSESTQRTQLQNCVHIPQALSSDFACVFECMTSRYPYKQDAQV